MTFIQFRHRDTTPGYSYKICPYSTNDYKNRLSPSQRSIHYTTSGRMELDIRDGHDCIGFVCKDPNCTYFRGLATEAPIIPVNIMVVVNSGTGEVGVTTTGYPAPLFACSGVRYWEK